MVPARYTLKQHVIAVIAVIGLSLILNGAISVGNTTIGPGGLNSVQSVVPVLAAQPGALIPRTLR